MKLTVFYVAGVVITMVVMAVVGSLSLPHLGIQHAGRAPIALGISGVLIALLYLAAFKTNDP